MKIERQDTDPMLGGPSESFTSLLRGASLLGVPRFDTETINALQEIINEPDLSSSVSTGTAIQRENTIPLINSSNSAVIYVENQQQLQQLHQQYFLVDSNDVVTSNGLLSIPSTNNASSGRKVEAAHQENVINNTQVGCTMSTLLPSDNSFLSFLKKYPIEELDSNVVVQSSIEANEATVPKVVNVGLGTEELGRNIIQSTEDNNNKGCVKNEVVSSTCGTVTQSLQPWSGVYDFNLFMSTDNKDRHKWCFSADLQKLYVKPNVAVPVCFIANIPDWSEASITILPIYKQSQFRREVVTRCHNCESKCESKGEQRSHILHVDGDGVAYKTIVGGHKVATVPLSPPLPGETTTTLLIKSTCLQSCNGGPYRRPFASIFTLVYRGVEVGRQILDLKCCMCPYRDMTYDDKEAREMSPPESLPQQSNSKVRKFTVADVCEGKSAKRPRVKLEPNVHVDAQYVAVRVPKEFESEVKSFINGLVAKKYIKEKQKQVLPYPAVE